MHSLARAGVGASQSSPESAPTQAAADALRAAAQVTEAIIADVRKALRGVQVEPPEKLTETSAADVLREHARSPGPVRTAARALSTLNRTLGEALTRT
ncbi:MAG: hypothetical protein WBQ44_16155 [Rhodococcus sp. (in: high G+C Gram-positive bacteria)]